MKALGKPFDLIGIEDRVGFDDAAHCRTIGTGPFVVTDFKPNDVITMKANDNYRDAAKPAFATLTLKGGGDAAA